MAAVRYRFRKRHLGNLLRKLASEYPDGTKLAFRATR